MIKYTSLFSGIGGFELGIQAASNQTGIKNNAEDTQNDGVIGNYINL